MASTSSNSSPLLAGIMPGMLRHEGLWRGTYRHLNANSEQIDTHHAEVECIFPHDGDTAYIQKNSFSWDDGRTQYATLEGILRDGKLWWDNEKFSGCAWESEFGLILLNLERKDDPGASFFETICLGEGGDHRARVWQWFKDGKLFKRTLCDEIRVRR